MSDGISSPPDGLSGSDRVTDSVTGVRRTGGEQGGASTPQTGGQSLGQAQVGDEPQTVRDPAVSIAASIADLRAGDRIVEMVSRIDSAGRPVLETPVANYALRPDAGLRPGDAVQLIIRDTERQLTADLVARNGTPIDPPVRLDLTVTALHVDGVADAGATPIEAARYGPLQRPGGADGGQPAGEALLAATRAAFASTATSSAAAPDAAATVTNPISAIAALVSEQQGIGAATTQPVSAPTAPTALGPAIAVTAAGAPLSLNPISEGLAALIPSDALRVQSVTSLTLEEIRMLALPIQSLQNSDSPLTRVETVRPDGARGPVVYAPLPVVSPLVGRPVFAASIDLPSPAAPRPPSFPVPQSVSLQNPADAVQNGPVYAASFAAPGSPPLEAPQNAAASAAPQRLQTQAPAPLGPSVDIQLRPSGSAAPPLGSVLIQGETILSTGLAASGPQTTVDLTTAIGTFRVALPSAERPAIGDILTVLPTPSAADAEVPDPTLAAAAPLGAVPGDATPGDAAVNAQVAASASASLYTPPPNFSDTRQQAEAVLSQLAAVGDPGLVEALQARSAAGGPQLTNSVLFLLSALGRGREAPGDAWLGRDTSGARAGLIDSLRQNFARLFAPADGTGSDWRVLQLPFEVRDTAVSVLSFWWRDEVTDRDGNRRSPDDGEGAAPPARRFVVDVAFSVIGEVQLDGLIEGRHFDLTLRTEHVLPTGLGEDLVTLFTGALDANGYAGMLRIRESETFLIDLDSLLAQRGA